jgi:hypothetical protein
MKMPVNVWKEVVKIQRDFLWSGLEKKRKINWVNWDTVTNSRCDGGLGVRDLRRVNLSLLAKWKWRFLNADCDSWKLVLQAKYGDLVASLHNQKLDNDARTASVWWKDIANLEGNDRWFSNTVVKKVGDGSSTAFWTDIWIGNVFLKDHFPRLFSVSSIKEAKVAGAGSWVNGRWCWSIAWRRNLSVWEDELHVQLMEILLGASLSMTKDKWVWSVEDDGVFSVKSCYSLLSRRAVSLVDIPAVHNFVFQRIWKSVAPLKVNAFFWQALIDKIPSRSNLFRRGVVQEVEDTYCNRCGVSIETTTQILLHCNLASTVWYRVCNWLGNSLVNPPNLFISYASFVGLPNTKKRRNGFALIWHTVIWVNWKALNDSVFNNKLSTVEEVVDLIKVTAWRWFLG